jgi:very-short-patch-repair endonuclease
MAAVLASGPDALLSHHSAAELHGIRPPWAGPVHVTVPVVGRRGQRGIALHRRRFRDGDRTAKDGIPVASPSLTLVDLATTLDLAALTAAVNEADRLGLTDPEALRDALEGHRGRRGSRRLRELLDRETFVLTESELERMLVPIALRAGLGKPDTQVWLNGFRVDFVWPELRLVVETDGLTYHRTPTQQARDRLRDQAHVASGWTVLRFTHAQVRFDPGHVEATLRAILHRREGAAGR